MKTFITGETSLEVYFAFRLVSKEVKYYHLGRKCVSAGLLQCRTVWCCPWQRRKTAALSKLALFVKRSPYPERHHH